MDVLGRHLESWPVDTVAVGVARPDGVAATHGPTEQVLPWASLTKLVTAYATLRLVERGVVDLDAPAGPEGSTVRHLLAHTSGLPFDESGTRQSVGRRRVYSNVGFEVLGEVLTERTGSPVGDVLRDLVLDPLGIADARFDGSPAHGLSGSLDGLLQLARELLAPTRVHVGTLADATRVAFPGLSGVLPGFGSQPANDWGLGFELRDEKSPHWTGRRNSPRTFGHFGGSGSFLWVDPDLELACACLCDRPFGDWAVERWGPFSDAVVDGFA